MKNKNALIVFLTIMGLLLSSCGGNSPDRRRVTNPPYRTHYPSFTTINLRAENMGNVSSIDFTVQLPSNTKANLLDYNGQAKIKGRIESSKLPCLKGSRSFDCNAQLSVGNINVSHCSVNGHNITMLIVLSRGTEIKETYSIKGIELYADFSCYYSA